MSYRLEIWTIAQKWMTNVKKKKKNEKYERKIKKTKKRKTKNLTNFPMS